MVNLFNILSLSIVITFYEAFPTFPAFLTSALPWLYETGILSRRSNAKTLKLEACMATVSFTQMKHGTREDYQLLHQHEESFHGKTAQRLLAELKRQGQDSLNGYPISRLEHSLQSATRAWRDNANDDWIVAALLHDIGDGLAPQNHDRMAAEIIRPFVSEEVTWVIEHHGAFQMIYYAHHIDGWNPNDRDQYAGHSYYQSAVDFCERWDQNCFEPDYENQSLEFFAPFLERVFARKAYAQKTIKAGEVSGLPIINHAL